MAKAWPVPGLGAWDSFRTAGGRVVLTRSVEVLSYRQAVLDRGDVEDVHDLRVAIRRLRANLDAFRDAFDPAGYEPRRVRLRDLARALGEVRDADVMAGMLESRLAKVSGDPDGADLAAALRALTEEALGESRRDRASRLRRSAGDELAAAIADLQRFVTEQTLVTPDQLDLELAGVEPVAPEPVEPRERSRRAWPDRPAGPGLAALLLHRLKQVRSADDAVSGPDDGEGLHELRIRIKRLRYVGEVGALVLPGGGHEAIGDLLGDVQDELGEVHDADVLAGLAREHRAAGGEVPEAGWEALAETVTDERTEHLDAATELLDPLRDSRWKPVRAMARELEAAR